jgi:hypothetical protein
MNKNGTILIFLLLIILIIGVILISNKGFSNEINIMDECYEKCRVDGNSKYYCERRCNIDKENKTLSSTYWNMFKIDGPIDKEKYIKNPLPSESNGKNEPMEILERRSYDILEQNEEEKIEIPEPGIPKTIRETFI